MDELTEDEVVRLLAVGIAMELGHTFAGNQGPGLQPGPNTLHIAREAFDAVLEGHRADAYGRGWEAGYRDGTEEAERASG